MASPSPDIAFLEELAANAWPPYIQQVVDGWRLRFTPGVRARRSNSVLPAADSGGSTPDERMAVVEAFYQSRGQFVRYQVSPAAVPAGLDSLLEARGYRVEAPVDVQVAKLSDVLAKTEGARSFVQIEPRPTVLWLHLWTELFRRGDPDITRQRVLERIAPTVGFALLVSEGEGIAVGMGVLERRWLGLHGMGTKPDARRRGAARSILHGLARWASESGAASCYLQVEGENKPAHRLYEQAGFTTLYGYHYRTRET